MCHIRKSALKYINPLGIWTYITVKFELLAKDEKYGSDNILR